MIPVWAFIAIIGGLVALAIAINAYLVYTFRGLDRECRVISLQIAEHKTKLEINTFTMKELTRVLNQLFGKPTNGGVE